MEALTLSVVIPAYNESGRILNTLQNVVAYLQAQDLSWEVIIVDDGSTDSTASIVEMFAAEDSRVQLLRVLHRGKGWAIRNGMLRSSGSWRFLCDADLSVSIDQITRFLTPFEYDIAVGSREIPGSRRTGEPRLRYLSSRFFNAMVRMVLNLKVSDSQCGFKCFSASAATKLFATQRIDGFSFDPEVLFLASKWGMRTKEIPVEWHFHADSKVRVARDSLGMFLDLLRIRWSWWRHRYHKSTNSF